MNQKKFSPALWFFILSMIGTLMHVDMIDKSRFSEQQLLHQKIVTHTAEAPYQFRILQPVMVQSVIDVAHAEPGSNVYRYLFIGGYAAIRLLAIFLTYSALYAALSMHWSRGTAMLGVTAVAAFLPFTYRYYYYQPTSIIEMALFAIGLLVIFRRSAWALLPLTVLGTLNRETMCFIPFAYFMYWLPQLKRTEWAWLVACALGWVAVFMGLRLLWPVTTDLQSMERLAWYIKANLELSRRTLDLLLMLAPAILVAVNYRQLPAHYLRLAFCMIPWVALHFFTAWWHEIRYYIPSLIWLLPSLVAIFSQEKQPVLQETRLGRGNSVPLPNPPGAAIGA